MRASFGHSPNQDMVVQFISDGNIRILYLKLLPMGLKPNIIFKFAFNLVKKNSKMPSKDISLPVYFRESFLIESHISLFSSTLKRFGAYPRLRILLISYKNYSFFIMSSENKKHIFLSFKPTYLNIFFKSYRNCTVK